MGELSPVTFHLELLVRWFLTRNSLLQQTMQLRCVATRACATSKWPLAALQIWLRAAKATYALERVSKSLSRWCGTPKKKNTPFAIFGVWCETHTHRHVLEKDWIILDNWLSGLASFCTIATKGIPKSGVGFSSLRLYSTLKSKHLKLQPVLFPLIAGVFNPTVVYTD